MQSMSQSVHKLSDRASALTSLVNRFAFALARAGAESRFLLHASGKLRRFLLVHFRKNYVQGQLLKRQGGCRQCGTCCNLLFTCPLLTKPGRCLVYGVCRPGACQVFPIDQRDIDEVRLCGRQCGYSFEPQDIPMLPRAEER